MDVLRAQKGLKARRMSAVGRRSGTWRKWTWGPLSLIASARLVPDRQCSTRCVPANRTVRLHRQRSPSQRQEGFRCQTKAFKVEKTHLRLMFIQEDRKEAFWIVGYPLSRTEGVGGRTEGGVSEREEETDVETETDR